MEITIPYKQALGIISYVTTKVTARQINLPVSPFHPDLKIRGYLPPALFSVLFATASNPGIRFNFVQKADAICCHCAYFHPLRSQPLSEICHSWLRSLFILEPDGYRGNFV
ncbi:hypothetical protein [Microseira sp. BLCC-F43]|jgi:hypothetical protein|uniref:hypothetical protein n=1 Tax=Microseira sp. BLCC-F43 TaxID=3153602 RepID=UPI0035B6B4BF